jgi:hypothetical protein
MAIRSRIAEVSNFFYTQESDQRRVELCLPDRFVVLIALSQ